MVNDRAKFKQRSACKIIENTEKKLTTKKLKLKCECIVMIGITRNFEKHF